MMAVNEAQLPAKRSGPRAAPTNQRGAIGRSSAARMRQGRQPASVNWALPAVLLVLAIIFGGGTYQRSWPDMVVQLASLPILIVAAWQIAVRGSDRWVRAALVLTAAMLALPLLQLLPPRLASGHCYL